MTERERRLEAPHRRLESNSRLLERGVVVGYRAVAWLVAHIPPGIPRTIIAGASQVSYVLWPSKRRFVNANYGHVLGLSPNHPRVWRTAMAAYREYARYVVETMTLPHIARDQAGHLVPDADLDVVEPIWRESKGGLIFALAHLGNADAVAAGVASRGWPINVLADDSAFPEMFEEFRRTREHWGVHVIPWRNLREIYTVLRRREMLGLLVDWGYRADGIPVRLFDAWTTLPPGPAELAAKTHSRILPIAIRRRPDGRTFHVSWGKPIEVPSAAPADILVATQRIADEIAEAIGAAPSQWYNFKPIWPSEPSESTALEARAAVMAADTVVRGRTRGGAPEAASGEEPGFDGRADPSRGDGIVGKVAEAPG